MNNYLMRHILKIWILITSSILSVSAVASPVTVKAKLDSVNLLMGRLTTLNVEVVQNEGVKGHFEIFNNNSAGYVGVCGDSVELRTSYRSDTVKLGSGRIQINYQIPVQAFDSGSYRLPELVYVAGQDTALSNRVSLKVNPVVASVDEPIAGFAPVADPEGKSVFDNVPDWLYYYWWVILLAIILIVLFVWSYLRYKNGQVLPVLQRPEPSPYEKAMSRLTALKERKLWEHGLEKEYFTELTDILRSYLDARFGINAMEMTSRQIMDSLKGNPLVKEKRDYMRRILDIADFVKFAKVRPLPADNIKAYENAVSFVEETHALSNSSSELGDNANILVTPEGNLTQSAKEITEKAEKREGGES